MHHQTQIRAIGMQPAQLSLFCSSSRSNIFLTSTARWAFDTAQRPRCRAETAMPRSFAMRHSYAAKFPTQLYIIPHSSRHSYAAKSPAQLCRKVPGTAMPQTDTAMPPRSGAATPAPWHSYATGVRGAAAGCVRQLTTAHATVVPSDQCAPLVRARQVTSAASARVGPATAALSRAHAPGGMWGRAQSALC